MKITLKDKIYIVLFIILLLIVVIGIRNHYKKEVNRLKNNYEAVIEENGRQQEIKMKEYRKFYEHKYDSLAEVLEIKRKNIETIIVTKYNWKDTIVKKYETVVDYNTEYHSEVDKFDILEKCYQISGEYFEGYVSINAIEFNDRLTTFTYKDHKKKFLFLKFKPFYTTKVYSECKEDTIKVEENIKIIKDKRIKIFNRNR